MLIKKLITQIFLSECFLLNKIPTLTSQMTQTNHTTEQVLIDRIINLNHPRPGELYAHYKNPTQLYRVLTVGFDEQTENPVVIYQATYGKELVWVRMLSVWNAMVEHDGSQVPRFQKMTHINSDPPGTIKYDDELYVSLGSVLL